MNYLARLKELKELKELKRAETHPTKPTETIFVVSVARVPAQVKNSTSVLPCVGVTNVSANDPARPVPQQTPRLKFGDGPSPFTASALSRQRVNSPVTKKPADWKDLDRAYQAHHIACQTCIAAGKGNGLRCDTGSALLAAYDAVDKPKPKRATSVTPPAKTDIHPLLLSAATNVEIERMAARLALFDARGLSYSDAEALADKLLVRDREGDSRGVCAECCRLVGYGPGRWRCGDMAPVMNNELSSVCLGAAFVHLSLHRCYSFAEATP